MSRPPIIQTVRDLQDAAERERAAGRRIALVPTMGALHAGHLSLVKAAREHADVVWMSIFVNPTQFNDSNDFGAYPADLSRDLELCASHGVDLVFAPAPGELYPEGAQTWVEVGELAESLCGATRAGHFRGVTTVVTKLFLAARPHVAVFGQKDFQQLVIIRRMERDLDFGIEIVGAATVREPDGLALSSRNLHLGPQARQQALVLVRALDVAEDSLARGEASHEALVALVARTIDTASLARLDYAELRDPDTLRSARAQITAPTLLALAVHFAPDPDGQGRKVRLIDNRVLQPQR
jgi:pantoate--beta-alanine ligase